MYFTQEDLSIIKNSITSRDVAEYYGVDIRRNSMLCPLPEHNDTHYGSCNFGRDGSLHCYVCNKTIDPISLTMAINSVNFPTALQQLSDMIGYVKQPEAPAAVAKIPFLSKEEKMLLGLSTSSAPVKMPSTISSFRPSGNYQIDFEGDEELYIGVREVTNPTLNFAQEDPEAYVSLIVDKCNEQIASVCERALQAQKENFFDVVDELKEKYATLVEIKGKFLKTSFYKKSNKAVGRLPSFKGDNEISGGYCPVYCLSDNNFKTVYTMKQAAKFIVEENLYSPVKIYAENHDLLLAAAAFHIDYCADNEYKKCFLKSFVPMQKDKINDFFLIPDKLIEPGINEPEEDGPEL